MRLGFKPMLSGTVDDISSLTYPMLASPKLDGIRAIVLDGVLVSRNLKPIPNAHVQSLFGKIKLNNMDGELLVAGDPGSPTAFRDTSSAVMSRDGKPDVIFYVFDSMSNPFQTFTQRYASIAGRMTKNCVVWPSVKVNTPEELTVLEERWLAEGYEGVMLRNPNGFYKYGRSTLKEGTLLKLKRFADSEAEVIGIEEQMANTNEAKKDALGRTERSSHRAGLKGKGVLGAFLVKDLVTGVEFSIGTGMDDALRGSLWLQGKAGLLGKVVKYKYFPTGSKERPRFPVFIGFRDPIDL